MKLRVVTVVGTRPELIRLSRVIATLDRQFDHVLIHTGQNYDYELNEVFFKDLQIRKPDFFLNAAKEDGGFANTIGNIISATDKILADIRPTALLVLGDTNSCLAVIPAKRRRIVVFHMEAGNRCFDERVPEEINRRIVDHTADVNMPYSDLARDNLLREGLHPSKVIKTGSPMKEVLDYYAEDIEQSDILTRLNIKKQKYFLVSLHREENVDDDKMFKKMLVCLSNLASEKKCPVIVSTHPRLRPKIEKNKNISNLVEFHKPFGFFDYVKLQSEAQCVLSDSGTINEESSILGFPALNLRESHERPEAMDEAAVPMVGLDWPTISCGIELVTNREASFSDSIQVQDYSSKGVSEKVATIILSYVGYVRKNTWFSQWNFQVDV